MDVQLVTERLSNYYENRKKTLYWLLGFSLFSLLGGSAAYLAANTMLSHTLGQVLFSFGLVSLVRTLLDHRYTRRAWEQAKKRLFMANRTQFLSSEEDRLENELPRLKLEQTILTLVLLVGIVLSVVGSVWEKGPGWLGTGIGLLLEGGVLLAFAVVREWTASLFLHFLYRQRV
ncbi:MAG: hypothetical protein AAGH79_00885 [Bacteroidota bacterium]